ncbi:MAG: T9SS type A sorting domain-containing protein [Bacteroidota bacterium]
MSLYSQIHLSLEAEVALLSGTANIVNCDAASEGQMVRDVDNGMANSLESQDVTVSEAGRYFFRLSYVHINDREFSYQLNGRSTVTHSIFGNPVSDSSPPNIGAYNWTGDVVNDLGTVEKRILRMFPNPVKAGELLTLQLPTEFRAKQISVQLMDQTGKHLTQQTFEIGDPLRIETEGLAPGSYFLHIQSDALKEIRQLVIL